MKFNLLPKSFYLHDPAVVSKKLLGKILVRRLNNKIISGKIVETEAYYGLSDPASRVTKRNSQNFSLKAGEAFIYNVHDSWLLNIVANKNSKPQGVLIRALEPLEGQEIMKKNRNGKDGFLLINGPGKLTQALKINKSFHGMQIYGRKSNLMIAQPSKKEPFAILSSNRIGVRNDLKRKLRFYIKENKWVSKK